MVYFAQHKTEVWNYDSTSIWTEGEIVMLCCHTGQAYIKGSRAEKSQNTCTHLEIQAQKDRVTPMFPDLDSILVLVRVTP